MLVFVILNFLFTAVFNVTELLSSNEIVLIQSNTIDSVNLPRFFQLFSFSVQTFSTVGYGGMIPVGLGNYISMIECFVGPTYFGLITSLIFFRFSTPKHNLRFSKNLVIFQLDRDPVLMLRIWNLRQNLLIDCQARLFVKQKKISKEGYVIRYNTEISLVNNNNPKFQILWSIYHAIRDGDFFIQNTDKSDIVESIVILITAYDTNLQRDLKVMKEYFLSDIKHGFRFSDILDNRSYDTKNKIYFFENFDETHDENQLK